MFNTIFPKIHKEGYKFLAISILITFGFLFISMFLGFIFTCFQAFEYVSANFTISDSIYGSTFFLATGFHGFHVFIGTVFLTVCLIRMVFNHFTVQHHFGFEAAAFY